MLTFTKAMVVTGRLNQVVIVVSDVFCALKNVFVLNDIVKYYAWIIYDITNNVRI